MGELQRSVVLLDLCNVRYELSPPTALRAALACEVTVAPALAGAPMSGAAMALAEKASWLRGLLFLLPKLGKWKGLVLPAGAIIDTSRLFGDLVNRVARPPKRMREREASLLFASPAPDRPGAGELGLEWEGMVKVTGPLVGSDSSSNEAP